MDHSDLLPDQPGEPQVPPPPRGPEAEQPTDTALPEEAKVSPVPETEMEELPAPRRRRLPGWLRSRENFSRALFLLGPWCCYVMVEVLNNNDPIYSLNPVQLCFNLLWYYLFFWLPRLLLGRRNIAAALASGLCFLAGLANHYVLTFRGRIIFPCDVLGLRTALNVAGDYDYTPDLAIWKALCLLALYWCLLLASHLYDRRTGRQRLRRATVAASWLCMAGFLFAFFCTPLLPTVGIYTQQWKTQANGFVLNFMTALRNSFVSAPEGYSAEAAQEIADRMAEVTVETPELEPPTNLIVIMNESLADMQASFPNLELSDDPLSFYHSLTENTVKGTMISPVTGGGTANVEFEFLTGGSLEFLPASTVAYQLYFYDGLPSLVSQAKSLDYTAAAFHPYLSSGWNRTSVYQWLGFDQQLYQEDVVNPRTIRQYISDRSDYEQLCRLTEETEGNTFLFNVTMQNHSGYAQGWNNLDRTIQVTGTKPSASSITTQYFSLVDESDQALEELIDYYSASSERTMIVLFGDHQPPLGNSFYEALYGKPLDARTTEEVFQQYSVPFMIWANYDIPEASDITISSNFLGVLTAQLAGFPLSDWQKFLTLVMEQLPVATTVGYMTADGTVTSDVTTLSPEVQELYEDYRLMAYNLLFDKNNHPEGFYD